MTPRRGSGWFEKESFWRDLYPFMFSDAKFSSGIPETAALLRLARPKGKSVLDLCCGPGRHATALAKRGYRVTGVDRSRFLLSKARRRARGAKAKIEWVGADMREFVRPGAFDFALNMFTSFGYFEHKREDTRVLRNMRESLKPGGVCLIDVMGKEGLARKFAPSVVTDGPDGATLIQRHTVLDDWTRLRNEWILIRRGRTKTYRFELTIYSGQELRDRMEAAGFVGVKLYGGLEGEPYGLESSRLVAVGRRPRAGARAKVGAGTRG
ncbi:MAG TPA: class I SAM-dependent methyltransferase [Candidatus Eisenbacteria bacterium]|nr:class I SAM-dependent methyltransferase [Candidatus Eisenbacteria bacterium]